jgi:hypothetical protein
MLRHASSCEGRTMVLTSVLCILSDPLITTVRKTKDEIGTKEEYDEQEKKLT